MLGRVGVALGSVGVAIVFLASLAACGRDYGSPFSTPGTRPAPADAVVLFLSGAWAEAKGEPRELFASNADGTRVERLSSCGQMTPPCDFLRVSASPDRSRIAAIRSTPNTAEGVSGLYFMDLDRSVEQVLFPQRRVTAVDWSPDGTMLLYQSTGDQPSDDDDLFLCDPNGANDRDLTPTELGAVPVRQRNPRFDPFSRGAVYERIDASGVSRIYVYREVPVTSGPASGPALPGTPYLVGGDADPAFSPDGTALVFRRLTGTGNGGLGTWDLMTVKVDGSDLRTLVTGSAFRGPADWSTRGIVFVETDTAADESRLVVIQADGSSRTVLRTEAAGYRMAAPRWLRGS